MPQAFAGNAELASQVAEVKRVADAQTKNLATAMNQLQEMTAEFQKMRGDIDASQHNATQSDRVLQDNQKRLDVLEERYQLILSQLQEMKAVGLVPLTQAKKLDEFQKFEKGLDQFNSEDYKGAAVAFKNFLANNDKSLFAENAQYWTGESFYALRDFPAAVSEFQKVIQKYPKGSKVAIALLRQGYAFFEMQSFEESKAFLEKVVLKYPGSTEAIRASQKIDQIKELLELKQKEALERKAST